MPVLAGRGPLAPDPQEGVIARDEVASALAVLSPRQRACVVLRFYDDLSVIQISDALGCSQGSVKKYLSEGLARMEKALTAADEGDQQCPTTWR
jgi:RNA polymerase sigma-70 factor (ECF subfamily)